MGTEKLYRRTNAGRRAVDAGDLAIPYDYRQILAVLEKESALAAVRAHFPDWREDLLAEWLGELEELGLVETIPASPANIDSAAPHAGRERETLARERSVAGALLLRPGAYIAKQRLAQRAPGKPPSQTSVLVVDDDADHVALADLRLTTAGYQVRVARSVKELVDSLRGNILPDLVLLDVLLPDGDGFDVLAKLRGHSRLMALPVVVLSARDRLEDLRKGFSLGADAYVTKPYSKSVLLDTIRQVLKQGDKTGGALAGVRDPKHTEHRTPDSGAQILERRTKGLAAIRREFLTRYARVAGIAADSSLVIRWRGLGDYANSRTVVDASFELVLHGGKGIAATFPDRWIVCYPDDPEIRRQVEAELDRMCEEAVKRRAS